MGEVVQLLDCDSPDFDGVWADLHAATLAAEGQLWGPRRAVRSGGLRALAARALEQWRPLAVARARRQLPLALRGQAALTALAGFCAHGFLTARFLQCFDVDAQAGSLDVAACLRGLVSGPVDTQEWGPLEFSESSRWPIKLLDVRLLEEHWTKCGTLSAEACLDVTALELRRGLDLPVPRSSSGPLSPPLRVRSEYVVPMAHAAMERQLVPLEAAEAEASLAVVGGRSLRFAVIGSHMGSNMEPLSLVLAWARMASVAATPVVYGTVYPWPEMICELFGYCERNEHIDEVVGLLVRQMYRPNWDPAMLLRALSRALRGDPQLEAAELIVCAQPMVVCAMLRGLVEIPMLVYQAFPLIGATPPMHASLLLLQFREMLRAPARSAFVVYSEFLAVQFDRQTGQRPTCIRPHSLYAAGGIRYDPDRLNPRILVSRVAGWARDGAGALLRLVEEFADRDLRPGTNFRFVFLGANWAPTETVAGISQPFGYPELRRFRGAVFFPWDMGMLLFSELYNLGVPLLMPSRSWMASIMKRMLEYTDFGWWQVRHETAVTLEGHGPSLGPTSDPASASAADWEAWPWIGANSSVKHVLAMYDLTDFVRWPYVTAFSSLPDLMAAVQALDYDDLSEKMLRWNDASLQHSMSILARTMGALLGAGSVPPVGESSCI
eukprot:TRINITY_DN17653_c0_g1_i1.p1 TRINITY_DN17653_c0_g1~~TRINITY_DN17653_c0_g1_i1.p1  ORF type:complete len:665 (-),score=100.47 TRINITY_DN17653_c0_g1_i1:50-2044(-)